MTTEWEHGVAGDVKIAADDEYDPEQYVWEDYPDDNEEFERD